MLRYRKAEKERKERDVIGKCEPKESQRSNFNVS